MNKVHLKGLEKSDQLNIQKNLKIREKIVRKSSSKPILINYKLNHLANQLHPKNQFVKVAKIIKENDYTKTFILVPNKEKGTNQLAYFKAGQYISVCVSVGEGIYCRPYTISCSPKHAINGEYAITIAKVDQGVVSNYFFEEVEEGFSFSVSAPVGNFTYSPLRDAKHVVALAGGNGIIPFVSMAEAIYDGILDFELTILYGAETKEDLILREKLEDIACKCDKINVVYILSEEDDNEFTTGLIDERIINKYMKEENSFFVCGSLNFYSYINDILSDFNLPNKYVRHDLFMGEIDLKSNERYQLTILTKNQEFLITCRGKQTLLQAMEEEGILLKSHCHVGECGFCRSKLISGKVKTFDENIRNSDKEYNYIHPCATYPESDVVIKLPN